MCSLLQYFHAIWTRSRAYFGLLDNKKWYPSVYWKHNSFEKFCKCCMRSSIVQWAKNTMTKMINIFWLYWFVLCLCLCCCCCCLGFCFAFLVVLLGGLCVIFVFVFFICFFREGVCGGVEGVVCFCFIFFIDGGGVDSYRFSYLVGVYCNRDPTIWRWCHRARCCITHKNWGDVHNVALKTPYINN